ncbi:DUF928 domain-containing protein [Planktothrix pseudagardhii]|uniref:DUF928 domain-containing protein n=1 Tax=Planktothrix pseudagardhii TaxID=132604 RepID=A0A9W4GB21_9CYAN|nr:DUF928 domain-containing protein [Planktothrix pseudagardhii]CAD5982997.1 hypothetical protein NO713_05117 [Planktothrix pseudagardhii]
MVIKSVGYLSLILGMMLPVTASLAIIPAPVKNGVNSPMEISLKFPDAPKGDGPVSTAGGGTRGTSCGLDNTKLTALVPSQNTLTVSANPTFFVYIPKLNQSQILKGEFELIYNPNKNKYVTLYKTNVKLPLEPSIVKIPLPKTVTLEPGIKYQWTFAITCNTSNFSDPTEDFVGVYIQRNELTPTLKQELEQTQNPLKKAEIYARENIWQDTLMSLAQLRDSQQEEWKSLLTSIKIEESIIDAPFAPESTVSNSEEQSAQ